LQSVGKRALLKRAFITGVTGQDGLYLCERLLGKGYHVVGLLRGQNNPKLTLLQETVPDVEVVTGDLLDLSSLMRAFQVAPQRETTLLWPRSPYGVAKVFAHYVTASYRESYGMHASSWILFNHELPRRGPEFVTWKVTRAVARIALGLQDSVSLSNLDARRDWGVRRRLPPGRSRSSRRGRDQGACRAGLAALWWLPGAGTDDGGQRPGRAAVAARS
jgi:GDP-D-mannose dehydratase